MDYKNKIMVEIESESFTKIINIKNFLIAKYKMYEKQYLEIMNREKYYAKNPEFNTVENIMLFIEDIYINVFSSDIAKAELCNGVING